MSSPDISKDQNRAVPMAQTLGKDLIAEIWREIHGTELMEMVNPFIRRDRQPSLVPISRSPREVYRDLLDPRNK